MVSVYEGKLHLNISGVDYEASQGDSIFIPANSKYDMRTENEVRLALIFFQFLDSSPDLSAASDAWMGNLKGTHFKIPMDQSTPVAGIAEHLVRAHMQQTIESALRSKGLLYELLARLLHCFHASTATNGLTSQQIAYVARAKGYIERHVDSSFALDRVASEVGLSRYYLSRIFQQCLGVGPREYHTSLRMKKASMLIEFGHLTIGEVSDHLGFSSIHAFSRAFKAYYGVSPTRYKSGRVGRPR